jgi:phosphate transport system permease protein
MKMKRSANKHVWRKAKSALASTIAFFCALLVIAPLALVLFHLLRSGASAVNWSFFTELPKPVGVPGGGMVNAIAGSCELLGLAALVGVPVGVFGGVYLAEYGTVRANWLLRFVAHHSIARFVPYRVVLGLGLVLVLAAGWMSAT